MLKIKARYKSKFFIAKSGSSFVYETFPVESLEFFSMQISLPVLSDASAPIDA